MPGLSRGVGQVEGGIAKSVKRKKISGLEGEKFMSSLIGTIDYDRFKEVSTYNDKSVFFGKCFFVLLE